MSRRVRYADRASKKIESQIDYLLSEGAVQPAQNLRNRIQEFVQENLAVFPESGRKVSGKQFWEVWISKT